MYRDYAPLAFTALPQGASTIEQASALRRECMALPSNQEPTMPTHDTSATAPPYRPDCRAPELSIAQLAGQVYEAAPAAERCRLLEHLMQPLGVLSLVAVANGVFAKLWFRSGWHDLHIQTDDAQRVRVGDVIKLVDYVQQARVEALDDLAHLLASSPMMAYSAAAAVLVAVLVQRAQSRKAGKSEIGDCPFHGT
jgi:hypothetical protein